MKGFHMVKRLTRVFFIVCLLLGATFAIAFKTSDSRATEAPTSQDALNEKAIVVVIPSYKNKDWYERNLDSVFAQNYHNFRVLYIDDASPDGTGALVKAHIRKNNQQGRVQLIQNAKRIGALANLYKGIWMCAPDEIIVTLDGDDWFYDANVLSKLNQTYADPNVWVTYGQFVHYPCGSPGWAREPPLEYSEKNAYREYSWVTTHLRTFYAGLFQKIHIEDLLYNGEFYPMAWDLAFMFPMLEMAGPYHSRFIPDVLYVYNIATVSNDVKTDPTFQHNLGLLIRKKNRYSRIDKPYDQ
jgi:glycosyltransferase involved in cell wall biosynthesis